MNEEVIQRRAERGAAELDKRRPGWEREVKITKLDMAKPCRCVVGQLEGTYWEGYRTVFRGTPDGRMAVARGFVESVVLNDSVAYYAHLTRAWQNLIRDRRRR